MSKSKVPDGWKIVKIKDIFDRVRNPVEVIKDKKYTQIGIKSHGKGIFYKEPVTGEQLGNKSVFWVEPDCFIVNIVFAWEMAVARTTAKDKGYIASHRFPMYRPKINVLDLDFITYYFKSPRGKHLLNLASPGGAGRNKTLGQKEFEELEIIIPKDIMEQKKIATILSTCERLIELKGMLVEENKERKKGLLQKLLAGKNNEIGFKGEWKYIKLKDIFGVRKERTTVTKELPLYSLTIEDGVTEKTERYNREFLVKNDDKKYKITRKYDIVYNPSNLRYGAIAINKVENPVLLSPIYEVLYVKNDQLWDAEFIAQYLSSTRQIKIFSTKAEGTLIERMAVKIDAFLDTEIFVPLEIDEQRKIAVILGTLDREVELLKKEINHLKLQKKGLQQQFLTGEIRVRV